MRRSHFWGGGRKEVDFWCCSSYSVRISLWLSYFNCFFSYEHSLVLRVSFSCSSYTYSGCEKRGSSGRVIFLARSASRRVERVSLKQFVEGEMQQMRMLLPAPLSEGSSSRVSFESRKGTCTASSASLAMTFVN